MLEWKADTRRNDDDDGSHINIILQTSNLECRVESNLGLIVIIKYKDV